MSTTIESLELEIQSSSQSAEHGLNALYNSLDKLKGITKGGVGLTAVATQMKKLNEAVNKLSSHSIGNLRDLASALGGLKAIQGVKLSSTIAKSIGEIGDASGKLNAQGVSLLREIAPALSSLSAVKDVKISSTVAKGIGSISEAVNKMNVNDLGKISLLADAVATLSAIQSIKISSSIASQIVRLGDAAKSLQGVDLAIFGNLAEALVPLTTLGKANLSSSITALKKMPEVVASMNSLDLDTFSSKINQLTAALQPLASQMNAISSGFATFPHRIQQVITSTDRLKNANAGAAGSYVNLAARIGMAVASVRAIGRVIASAIGKSNDYIENLNLFHASMGQFASEAKEYAQHVADIMGINPGEWMRNQGIFMTLATGFGIVSNRAYIMSQNLTQLGYDLSSFFNISYQDSMEKLQSGISGELEPLRRLGYDLSQARLEAIALSLGIDQTFTSMTQAEKAQLRYYAIMTQVTTAHGDMARTLEAPANQLRILQAQVQQAAIAFGNIFIPVLNAALPLFIALAKAAHFLAAAIASLFGFSLPEIDYSGITDVTTGVGDMEEALGGAEEEAKKLKTYLLGFDELNVFKPQEENDGSGSGSEGGSDWDWELPTYDFIGDAVSSRVDEIYKTLEPFLNAVKEHIDEILALVAAVGTEFLLWKISRSLLPELNQASALLSQILAGLMAAATAVITVTLEYKLLQGYLETGKYGYLIASALSALLGSALVGGLVEKMHAGWGWYAASAMLAISAMIHLSALFEKVATDGMDMQAAMLALTAAVLGGLAGGALAKALGAHVITGVGIGFTITAAVSALVVYAGLLRNPDAAEWEQCVAGIVAVTLGAIAGAFVAHSIGAIPLGGAMIGFSITAAVMMIITAGDVAADTGVSWELAAVSAMAVITSALAGALLAIGLGASIAGGAVIGAAAGLALTLLATVIGIEVNRGADTIPVNWGTVTLTAEEMQTYAKELFTFDVDATIELVNTQIKNHEVAVRELNRRMIQFETELNKIKLGVEVDTGSTLTTMQEQLNGVIASLKQTMTENKQTIELSVSLVPPQTSEGEDLSASLLSAIGLSDTVLQSTADSIGKTLSDAISAGLVEGLSEDEALIITQMSAWLNRIETAVTQGRIQGEAQAKMSQALTDLSRESLEGVLTAYQSMVDELTASYTLLEEQAYANAVAYQAGLTEAQAYYLSIGDAVKAAEIQTALDEVNKLIEEWDIAGSVKTAVDNAVEPSREVIIAGLKDIFASVHENAFDSEYGQNTLQWFFDPSQWNHDYLISPESRMQLAEEFREDLKGVIEESMTDEDYKVYLEAQELFGIDEWDMLGVEMQTKFYQAAVDAFGAAEAQEMFEHIGYELTEVIANGITNSTSLIEDGAGNLVLALEDGTELAFPQTEANMIAMFTALGVDCNEGLSEGLTSLPLPVLQAMVELAKQGWETIPGWIGGVPTLEQLVALVKQGWTTVPTWIGDVPTVFAPVGLTKKGWTTVNSWIGPVSDINVRVNLMKGSTVDIPSDSVVTTQKKNEKGLVFAGIAMKAEGGFARTGEMFVAREAGPELVGRIGSRTAVANNDQIVEAVSVGVYQAVTAAMGDGNGGEATQINLYLDGEKVYENQQKVARNRGYNLGMGAFAGG